jgi:exonuclease SbcD
VIDQLRQALSPREALQDAMVRLIVEYPRACEALIDENAIHEFASAAFDFSLVRRPVYEARLRLPEDKTIGSLTPLELLDAYWKINPNQYDAKEAQELNQLAQAIIAEEQE